MAARDQIRLFVSSTFEDLGAERDALVRFAFPVAREHARKRGIAWSEVDLRWGITTSEAASGLTVPLCLREIDLCRPFFIGILGSRYGWRPGPTDLVNHPALEGSLRPFHGRSMTELELRYGGLEGPPAPERQLMFLLSSAGSKEPSRESSADAASLAALRAAVKRSSHPWWEYSSPVQLAETVLAQLLRWIDARAQERGGTERQVHERFAAACAPRRTHQGLLRRIRRYVRGGTGPLLLRGAGGAGKTAVLSHLVSGAGVDRSSWWQRWLGAERPVRLVPFFVEAHGRTSTWHSVLASWLEQLEGTRRDGGSPEEVRERLTAALRRIGPGKRVILLLDGFDQLDPRGQAREGLWLPLPLPPRVGLIASSRPGKIAQRLEHQGWRVVDVPALTRQESLLVAREYLSAHGKRLPDAALRAVASNRRNANPRRLRLVLEDLRQFSPRGAGNGREVEAQVDLRLRVLEEATDPAGLVAARIEQCRAGLHALGRPFSGATPESLRRALVGLLVSRDGLSDDELSAIIIPGEGRAPALCWAILRNALPDLMIHRSGLWDIVHDDGRDGIALAFGLSARDYVAAHEMLSAYFGGRAPPSERSLEAEIWSLVGAGQLEAGLSKLLVPGTFVRLWRHDRWNVLAYLQQFSERTNVELMPLLESDQGEVVWAAAEAALLTGMYRVAARAWSRLARKTTAGERLRARHHGALAELAQGRGRRALRAFQVLAMRARAASDAPMRDLALAGEAMSRLHIGDSEGALRTVRALIDSTSAGKGRILPRYSFLLAAALQAANDPRAAEVAAGAERDSDECGDVLAMVQTRILSASRLKDRGKLAQCIAKVDEAHALARSFGLHVQADTCLALRAAALVDDGSYGPALETVSLREQAARRHQLGQALQETAEQRHAIIRLSGVG